MRRSILGQLVTFAALACAGCDATSITGLGESFNARTAADLVDAAVGHELGNLSTGHVGLVVQAVRNAPAASVIPGFDDRIQALAGRKRLPDHRSAEACRRSGDVRGRARRDPSGWSPRQDVHAGRTGGRRLCASTRRPTAPRPTGPGSSCTSSIRSRGRPKLIPPSLAGHLDLQEPIPGDALEVRAWSKGGDALANATIRRVRVDSGDGATSTFTSAGTLGRSTTRCGITSRSAAASRVPISRSSAISMTGRCA